MTTNDLTGEVVASFDRSLDPRTKEVMSALVRHLHAFAREVELTEEEWWQAIQFLTQVGQKCDDRRQEFVLLSDTLGASMLATASECWMVASSEACVTSASFSRITF